MAFTQTNDEKAIIFLDIHLKIMFKILNTKPQTISSTCMDSLKRLHYFKEKKTKETSQQDMQQEINFAILRALYTNSIQYCETDVQDICSHRVEPSIRKICKEMTL